MNHLAIQTWLFQAPPHVPVLLSLIWLHWPTASCLFPQMISPIVWGNNFKNYAKNIDCAYNRYPSYLKVHFKDVEIFINHFSKYLLYYFLNVNFNVLNDPGHISHFYIIVTKNHGFVASVLYSLGLYSEKWWLWGSCSNYKNRLLQLQSTLEKPK